MNYTTTGNFATPSIMLTQEEVRQKLLEFEYTLLDALAREVDESYYSHLRQLTEIVRREFALQQEQGTLTNATLQLGARVSDRLEQLGHILHEQRTQMQRIHSNASQELVLILRSPIPRSRASGSLRDRRDPTLNAKHMRDWFLRHLGHPFPSREDKEQILAETNACIRDRTLRLKYTQIVLWFINTRRRSGWTAFLRHYARGDKVKLFNLAQAIENEEGGTHETRQWSAGHAITLTPASAVQANKPMLSDPNTSSGLSLQSLLPNMDDIARRAMKREWSNIVDRVRIGAKERIGDWVDEVISAPSTASSSSQSRRHSTRRTTP